VEGHDPGETGASATGSRVRSTTPKSPYTHEHTLEAPGSTSIMMKEYETTNWPSRETVRIAKRSGEKKPGGSIGGWRGVGAQEKDRSTTTGIRIGKGSPYEESTGKGRSAGDHR